MQGELLRVDQSRSPREDRVSSEERLRPERLRTDCPVLLSERLVMRAPHEEDIDALAHLANNAKVATMVSRMPHPYTADDAADFVRRTKNGEIGKCVYAITKAENGAFIGCCGVEPHTDGRTVEIGYWLGEPYWNKGYTTEACHALVDMVFRTRQDVDQIDARCRVMNVASRRVIQKCGFQFQGSGLAASLALGSNVPVEWYRLDRKTWMSLRSWGNIA
ncbi:acetyltransferase, ribosomal protein N-acetylase [Rhizobium leguminosarum bv. trifolii WSM2297]|uniref:Acetyltransferase, ribosomal protein N-acetylase n=1 Tax=Rhizobium leguminosarum bv. trifolii WSM2297 TaxID=754762 RepID=J0CQ69_RHILT|nr:GNAT family protein [Rhizobium leguminosarum]EJC81815.1 acetyltransferase, ribosomal protein N-acetylase [Rhizobium leguminosarum bv. trifolii WSM2297]